MSIGQRLREERERLKVSQERFAAIGGVQKRAQINYEAGDRTPDAEYLAGVAMAGVDVAYVVTGKRGDTQAPQLTMEEQTLLHLFRDAAPAVRKAAIAALASGAPGGMTMSHVGDGNVQVGQGARVKVKQGQ
ncbi:hypothetical protein B5M06_13180 [Comamonas kerstersii]|uniref:HTH cro/C1-type domain-containing protein n=1 Tax=Comamonas kerstersii TaxID=225992 RepID=A0A1V0BGP7_9BURK|nr:helix-turn-helix transcriptional regulator [Comamonas kerstersii]AQZ99061.1 hypothetical protein B5M06_13180 [Comamonas kerstersii]